MLMPKPCSGAAGKPVAKFYQGDTIHLVKRLKSVFKDFMVLPLKVNFKYSSDINSSNK